MLKQIITIIMLGFILNSCASTYSKIEPEKIIYSNNSEIADLNFSYKYNVLNETGSDHYAKKEAKRLVKLLSIKIQNNSQNSISVKDDIIFLKNDKPVELVSPEVFLKNTEQGTMGYLFYLLLTPLVFTSQNGNDVTAIPIGYVLGPGLAFGNMLYANSANKSLEKNLTDQGILSKTIGPGETVHGLLCIQSSSYDPITILVKE